MALNTEFEIEEPSENSPLISPIDEHEATTPHPKPRQSWEKILFRILTIVLLVSLGDAWQEPPHMRLMESVICYRYYEQSDPSKLLLGRDSVGPGAIGGVAEMYCKADAVQSELAMLRGWQSALEGLPGLFLALPVGWAADRFGRKPFVFAGLLAYILRNAWVEIVLWFWQSFSIKAIWFSTIFASIGGGSPMTTTFLFVILNDITPEAKRADAFLRAGAVNIFAALIMPPFAALLMKYSPWIPALGGTLLLIIAAAIYIPCPETLNFQGNLNTTSKTDSAAQNITKPNTSLKDRAQRLLTQANRASSFLLNDWRIPTLLLQFIFSMLTVVAGGLLLQYLSKRYGLTFSTATLLLTIGSGVNVLLFFLILPYLSTLIMQRWQLSGARKDLYLVRASLVFIVLGWTLIGFSPNVVTVAISLAIASLGSGFGLLLRSFLASLVPAQHIARVYSIVTIVDICAVMVGSPVFAGVFKHGLALGGAWIGLPFYLVGLLGVVFLLLLFSVGLRKSEDAKENVDEDS